MTVTALPEMLIPQVPVAPEPVVEGTPRFDWASAAVEAPVPPLRMATVPVTFAPATLAAETPVMRGPGPMNVPLKKGAVTPPALTTIPDEVVRLA